MNIGVMIIIVILIIILNLFSARMISDWLDPKENMFDVWLPRVCLVPPFGIIGALVMTITLVWWIIRDIWE
jgi:amino acid transporter